MNRPRLIRGIRIAFSAVCGVVCVLLIVLWIRSYWDGNRIVGPLTTTYGFILDSRLGRLEATLIDLPLGQIKRLPYEIIPHSPEESVGDLLTGLDAPETRAGFFIGRTSWYWWVILPYWFVVLLVAVVPGLLLLARSTRFSLRTLLIATTLVALVLGLIAWATR